LEGWNGGKSAKMPNEKGQMPKKGIVVLRQPQEENLWNCRRLWRKHERTKARKRELGLRGPPYKVAKRLLLENEIPWNSG
jgi:hypothetical protein